MLTAAFVVVRYRAVRADLTGEFKQAVAIAGVRIPVPVGSEDGTVLLIRTWFGDALTALLIEDSAWRTAVGVQLTYA